MLRCLGDFRGERDKILFVGLRTDEVGLDTGKEMEGLSLIEIAGPVKSFSSKIVEAESG